jgi:hypothetical protein
MSKFKITDPQSGRTVTVSGDRPPSQQDAERIFKDAGLRQQTKPGQTRSGATGQRQKQLRQFRDMPETGKPIQDFARGAIKSRYRNIDKEPNLISKFVRGVSKAAPGIGSTIAGVAARPFGRKAGAAGAGAGYGAGQALGESLENLAGIQDETPQELARESFTKPATAAGSDYATDLGTEKVLKPFAKGVGKLAKGAGKIGKKAVSKGYQAIVPSKLKALFKGAGRKISEDVSTFVGKNMPRMANELFGFDRKKSINQAYQLTHPGKNLGEEAAKLAPNVRGDTYAEILENIGKQKNILGTQLDQSLKKQPGKIRLSSLDNQIESLVKTAKQAGDESRADSIKNVWQAIKRNNPDILDKAQANKMKSLFSEQLFTRTGKAKNVTPLSPARQQVYETVSKNLRNKIKENLDDATIELFEEYPVYIGMEQGVKNMLGYAEGMPQSQFGVGLASQAFDKATEGLRTPEFLQESIARETAPRGNSIFKRGLKTGGQVTRGAIPGLITSFSNSDQQLNTSQR